jgi:hypothetical protein
MPYQISVAMNEFASGITIKASANGYSQLNSINANWTYKVTSNYKSWGFYFKGSTYIWPYEELMIGIRLMKHRIII